MNDANHGGTPADHTDGAIEELDALWDKLQDDLATYLATMVDPDEGDHLLIELADPDPEGDAGCAPYAQFAAFGDGRADPGRGLRQRLPAAAVPARRGRLRVLHAAGLVRQRRRREELVHRARRSPRPTRSPPRRVGDALLLRDRPPAAADLPGLGAGRRRGRRAGPVRHRRRADRRAAGARDPTARDGPSMGPLAVAARGPRRPAAHRRGACCARSTRRSPPSTTTATSCSTTSASRSGSGSAPSSPRSRSWPGSPTTCARAGRPPSRSGCSTATTRGSSWTLHDRSVWQTILLPGSPFVPSHLDAMLDVFFKAMTATRDDLAYRLGAKVA